MALGELDDLLVFRSAVGDSTRCPVDIPPARLSLEGATHTSMHGRPIVVIPALDSPLVVEGASRGFFTHHLAWREADAWRAGVYLPAAVGHCLALIFHGAR